MQEDLQEILFDQQAISQRVAELGAQISADYADRVDEGIALVCVLRGAALFAADLARAITLPLRLEFVTASSYGMSAVSCGTVDVVEHCPLEVRGRHLLLVEDILDTGNTLSALMEHYAACGAKSVETVSFLVKENRPNRAITCRYAGFECADEFVVGYGLDYAQRYRNLPFVAVLKREVYQEA